LEGWAEGIDVDLGQEVMFRLKIENDGECTDIIDLEMVDILPSCLDYGNDAVIYYNGGEHERRPPDRITDGPFGGLQLSWDLEDIGPLAPGESIAIEYSAIAEYPGENINIVFAEAHCAYDYTVIVSDEDAAIVSVAAPPAPPAEEVLYAFFEAGAECISNELCSCWLTISFGAQDLTGGDYPVTSVVLVVNGDEWHDSEAISTVLYQNDVGREAGCGETFYIEVTAENAYGLTVTASGDFTTPSPEF